MDKIYHNKILLGIRVRKFSAGTNAITSDNEPLQVVALKHKKGEAVKPHLHAKRLRKIFYTQTCFIVKKGRIRIDIYNNDKSFVKSLPLGAGDFFISLAGGHAISYLTDAEVVEIKNGPFEEDKVIIGE
ncbi:MAG: putative cytosolic protein [Parcubacteria group bacterium GW2011_GWC2_42_12]|uniref:Sugar 3,4-ketoisomerase QdtA cupin domain-containing protein n=1 Tax=Candidatus Falkowbacteria bacterium RIFCSPHIGHO2_02_FULL_42_9 TaxID=1797986 RepID=A0A1F5S9Z3_9BACT|nr:MAG: putative cytosolic protein [Parcubacteria group bacterium GW2011_GWC2_42_12]OGF23469.1 MAG: hypothetical protein A3D45_01070 [Candidatus Falkowbacteria bacterium RIFCSPHIGHO2_02_FULL_42_9]